jgi:hypothetical protein
METMTEASAQDAMRVFRSAEEHRGQFLLGRREFREKSGPDFDACNALVCSGHARWLSYHAAYYPGIVLSGKPMEVA